VYAERTTQKWETAIGVDECLIWVRRSVSFFLYSFYLRDVAVMVASGLAFIVLRSAHTHHHDSRQDPFAATQQATSSSRHTSIAEGDWSSSCYVQRM
jgi:hypothetical protein